MAWFWHEDGIGGHGVDGQRAWLNDFAETVEQSWCWVKRKTHICGFGASMSETLERAWSARVDRCGASGDNDAIIFDVLTPCVHNTFFSTPTIQSTRGH